MENSTAKSKAELFMKSDLSRELNFLIARMRAIGSAHGNQALRPLDLKVRSYSVLSLACDGTSPTQRDLANFLSLDPSQIVPLVDDLEKRGLVNRMPDPSDRRSKVILATDAGRELYTKARQATARSEDETLSPLNQGEREQLRELLTRIALNPA